MAKKDNGKRLAYMLRHSQNPLYINLDGGWASVSIIICELNISRSELEEIVANDNKGRYAFDAHKQRIRACQGHSIPGVVVHMEAPEPPMYLYHGTATRFLDAVMHEGLKPMSRQWVHLSKDYDTAVNVGSRHGKAIVLRINAKQFVADGNELYISDNGVWQAKYVDPKYMEIYTPQEES